MVMVHGFLTHLEIYWESPRNAWSMRRYAKDLRILQFDKRGLGMSDRAATAPTLEIQMDDIRAVLDAAGVERAVVWASGSPGPALAAFFAAAHPERTVAMWLDGNVMEVGDDDYPWVESAEELEAWMDQVSPGWGSEGASTLEFARQCWPEAMDDPALRDPAFLRWLAKLARNAATPTSLRRFEEMWMATDVRPILRTICVPTAVALHEGQGRTAQGRGGLPRREHPRGASRSRAAQQLPWAERRGALHRRRRAVRRLGPGRGGSARPDAGDRALHRHRGLDARRPRDRRCALEDAARDATTRSCGHGRPLSGPGDRPDGRRLPRHLRRAGPRREVRAGDLRGGQAARASRSGPAATPARSS